MRPIQFLTIVQYTTSFLLTLPLAAVSAYAAEPKCNFRHVSIETSKPQTAAYTSGDWSPLRAKAAELARKGRLNESETYWTQAYEALLKKRGERDHETLEAMSTVAFLNMVHGRDDEAELLFGKLIPILDQSGPVKYITSEAYLYFYHFLRSRNRIVEARKVLARVATINELIDASPTTQAETFAELGAMHAVYDNNKPEAIACFKRATSLFSASFKSGNTFTTALAFSRIYNQIMFFALDLGDKTYAEEAGRRSVDLLQNANSDVYISLAQHNLAKVFLSVGKRRDAEKFAQSALTVARRARIDRIAEVQYLATLSRAVGQSIPDLSKAMSLSEEAFNIALDLRGVSDDAPQPRREPGHLRAYMSEVYGLSEYLYPAVSAFIDASWQSAASGVPEEQIRITEKAFEAIQYISLSEGASAIKDASLRRSTSDGPSAALLRQIQDLKAQLKVARREVLEGLASGDNDAVGSQIEWSKRAEERIRLLGGQLEHADPGLFNYIYPRSLTVSAVRSRLDAGEGLLLVTSVDDDVHTFVVTKDRLAWNRFEGGASSIKQLVEELLCGIDEANCSLGVSPTSGSHQGSEIYSMVIKPTLAALKDINSLYVSLSGPIASVPLGILPMDGTPGSEVPFLYLSDRFAMTVVPSAAHQPRCRSGLSGANPFVECSVQRSQE